MFQLSPNIELMFTEAGDHAARIQAAAAAGFDAVEMWGIYDHDLDALAQVLADTGVSMTSVIHLPRTNFAFPGTDLGPFLDGVDRGIDGSVRLNCPRLIFGGGMGFPGSKRADNLSKVTDAFVQAGTRAKGSGVTLVLEITNGRVDHPGNLIDRTTEAVDVIRQVNAAVGAEVFALDYDMYHSVVENEDQVAELANAGDLIDYVQIADSPGRGEPGSGSIDWPNWLRSLKDTGYQGTIGLECRPTVPSAQSMTYLRSVLTEL